MSLNHKQLGKRLNPNDSYSPNIINTAFHKILISANCLFIAHINLYHNWYQLSHSRTQTFSYKTYKRYF